MLDVGFLRRTYRSAAFVALFVAVMLASYGQFHLLLPFALGVGLSILLLFSWEVFVRKTYTVARAQAHKKSGSGGAGALIVFFLIKYPLVGLIIWAVVRFQDHDQVVPVAIMAFAGGYILVHFVIGLRAMGRFLTDRGDTATTGASGADVHREE